MTRRITQRQLRNDSGDVMRALVRAFAGATPIDAEAFRADIDRLIDQDPTPRG